MDTCALATTTLLPHHRAALHRRGLLDATIAAAGLYSVTDGSEAVQLIGWPCNIPAMAIPWFGIGGWLGITQLRADAPRDPSRKYEWPADTSSRIYVPPATINNGALDDLTTPLLFCEGAFKALSLAQLGRAAVAGTSVTTIISEAAAADLMGLPIRGRACVIVFDGDVLHKPHVADAEAAVALRLRLMGAASVRCLRIPPAADGSKVGVDDYLASFAHEAAQ